MKPRVGSSCWAAVGVLSALALSALPAVAQDDARVVVKTIKDSRFRFQSNDPTGDLTLFSALEGAALDGAKAFRITISAARDDTGTSLLPAEAAERKWERGALGADPWIRLRSPTRGASTVTVSGTLELYVPSRDPDSEVRVERALEKPGRPLVSKALKAAKIEIAVAPKAQTPEGTIVLLGRTSELASVRAIRVVRPDGSEIGLSGTSSGSIGEKETIELGLSEPAPPGTALVFTLMTEKSIVVIPFELKDVLLP